MAKPRRDPGIPKTEYPTCVRHAQTRKDVRLRHCFLCDACAEKWASAAFDGSKSLWNSEPVKGYCLLCNAHKRVRLRTWFLCDICWRVAASIGRNHVAERSILDWWRKYVEVPHPHLKIEQNDESALRPRRASDVSGESDIDFLVRDARSGEVVLAIENKTGRSAIREMSAFQLDVSDCDCILHAVRKHNVPAYLVHAQVLEIWEPPTAGFQTRGLWWTDLYQMGEHFRDVRMRRDEQRGAAYFRKQAFHDMDALLPALLDANGEPALLGRMHREGIPKLYELG